MHVIPHQHVARKGADTSQICRHVRGMMRTGVSLFLGFVYRLCCKHSLYRFANFLL